MQWLWYISGIFLPIILLLHDWQLPGSLQRDLHIQCFVIIQLIIQQGMSYWWHFDLHRMYKAEKKTPLDIIYICWLGRSCLDNPFDNYWEQSTCFSYIEKKSETLESYTGDLLDASGSPSASLTGTTHSSRSGMITK